MTAHINFISAGAGSGKTHALTKALHELLTAGKVGPKSVIATTFTKLAAKELKDRVRERLIKADEISLSEQIELARIGTVNSICGRLLDEFTFEAGMPPGQETLDETRADIMFRKALERIIRQDASLVEKMIQTASRLSVEDWEAEVKKIVDSARANNIEATDIDPFASTSASSLLAYFPKANTSFDESALDNALSRAISGIQNQIDQGIDVTGTTKKYLAKIKKAKTLLTKGILPWASWANLAKTDTKHGPGAKSREFGNLVQTATADFGQHPQLHTDITFFSETLFNVAAQSLETYQQFKAQRGLVDFVDQEQRLFETLKNPQVTESLQSNLDLLMVDEFQDTSPIQLAVFMKLAALAKHVIFVGDIKQSIYGFRGADPSLMESILNNLETLGIKDDILPNSWRSRPALVELVNDVFKQAFSNSLREDQIILNAKRDEIEGETAFESWDLSGGTIDKRLNALAQGVKALVESKRQIFDKAEKKLREVNYGDIAILCRKNLRLEPMSQALTEQKIPNRYVQEGLLKTPEAVLGIASLRRLADPSDVLAAAEIHTLTLCESPEDWLVDRLTFVMDETDNRSDWVDDRTGIFSAMATARDRLPFLTPVETLRLAMSTANVRETVTRWGPSLDRANIRVANLNRLVEIAEDYVAECELESEPATVAGLIFYFEKIRNSKLDTQAPSGSEIAVNILTHHAAKGLEWPIVILYDLDDSLKTRIWGLTVESHPDGVQIENPLLGRTLRYWPKLFDRNTNDIDILDQIMAGNQAIVADQREQSELQRLLYVSMTRARDCLIFALPVQKNPSFPWIETLGVGHFWPGANNKVFPSSRYSGTHKTFEFQELVPSVHTGYGPEIRDVSVKTDKIAARISPSSIKPLAGAKVSKVVELGNRLPVHGKYDVNAMGNALHGVIASHFMGHTSTDTILKAHKMDKVISAADAILSANRLERFIQSEFGECIIHCEYPIQYYNNQNQIISGWIDLLLETENGYVVIDHKASPQKRSEWEEVAKRHSGQLDAYSKSLINTPNGNNIESWIYFALTGGLVRLE